MPVGWNTEYWVFGFKVLMMMFSSSTPADGTLKGMSKIPLSGIGWSAMLMVSVE